MFVTLIGTIGFKKVPFDLAQAAIHFQQLINEVLKGLPFTFGFLDDILVFTSN